MRLTGPLTHMYRITPVSLYRCQLSAITDTLTISTLPHAKLHLLNLLVVRVSIVPKRNVDHNVAGIAGISLNLSS